MLDEIFNVTPGQILITTDTGGYTIPENGQYSFCLRTLNSASYPRAGTIYVAKQVGGLRMPLTFHTPSNQINAYIGGYIRSDATILLLPKDTTIEVGSLTAGDQIVITRI